MRAPRADGGPLRNSEQHYRDLIGAANQVLYRHNADWSEMRQLAGGGFLADTEQPDPDWFDKYIHVDDQATVWSAIQQAISTKSPFELEHRVIRQDGSLGWTLSRSIPIFDEHGEVVEWFGMAADVTERKRGEERLLESEDRLRLAAEAADVGTWDFNPATGLLRWDERCKRFFGLPPDAEVTYEIFLEGLHPEDRAKTDKAVKQGAEPDGPGEYDVDIGRSAFTTRSSAGSPRKAARSSKAKARPSAPPASSAPSSTSARSGARQTNSARKATPRDPQQDRLRNRQRARPRAGRSDGHRRRVDLTGAHFGAFSTMW